MKIYTKTGDKGKTSLLNGRRVDKYHPRIHAYGTVDELNSWVGILREHADENTHSQLIDIQNTLFNIGSHLAVEPGSVTFKMPELNEAATTALEDAIDQMNTTLPELRNFILPGGHISVAHCHVARTVCRRAERLVAELASVDHIDDIIVVFLNRLSDYLFVLSRKFGADNNAVEINWKTTK